MQYTESTTSRAEEIQQLFNRTFTDSEGPEEGELVGNLAYELMSSTDGQDIRCFIASEGNTFTGCIFFTKLTFDSGEEAFLLAPVAVHTDFQGKGIGQALINFALRILRDEGVALAFTYGDINFYSRVGFQPVDEQIAKAPLTLSYPQGWLAQSLTGDEIRPIPGNSHCVEAFNKPELW
ncbi:MAG: N-acetyltransferase [Anaerolineae bacterium]|jgi:putative acetyltransferase|nr:N-acetyltransferase [Anaerolineae bacterium]